MTLPDAHPFLVNLLRRRACEAIEAPEPGDPLWEDLVREGLRHNLLPLLHPWSLTRDGTRRIPQDLRAQLAMDAARTTARNLVLAEELRAILIRCRDRGLDCVPLRGLALAERLHGSVALRPTGDIDLLVKRKDIPEITGVLAGLGYAGMDHRPGFALSYSYTLEFIKERLGWIVVEPHWTLAYPPFTEALDMDEVWSRCRKSRVAGTDAWRLGEEDLLVHLCFHILHQGNDAPLLWWHELDLLVRRSEGSLDWDTVTSTADRAGQSLLVHDVLGTLVDRVHTPIPRTALDRLASRPAPALPAALLVNAPGLNGREEFAQFLSLPGVRARLRYALGLLCPAPGYMIRRYEVRGRARLGVAYGIRCLHLFREGLRWTGALLAAALSAKATLLR